MINRKPRARRLGLLALGLGLATSAALAVDDTTMEKITVLGHVQNRFSHQDIDLEESGISSADVANLISRVPGGNMNDNGPISGQTQYRGMFGPRMNVRLDGMYVNSGGPNWMDPPLHYMPASLLDSIEVTRGIASVSYGAGIGGHILADYKTSRFADSEEFEVSGEADIGAHSADGGYRLGGIVGLSNDTHRFHVIGSQEEGDDLKFDGGEIDATEYRRHFVGAGYGFHGRNHEFSLDYRYSDTGDSGTPVLPLDIEVLDTHLVKGGYKGIWGSYYVIAQVNYSQVDHRMNNSELRPAPDFSSLPLPPFTDEDRRTVDSDSNGLGYSLTLSRDVGDGFMNFGVDGHLAEHNAMVEDPDVPPFFVINFDTSETDTHGFFAEWRGDVLADLTLETGLRYNLVKTNTNDVDAQPANLPLADVMGTPPFAVRMLRDRFNVADHGRTDHNFDWVTKLDYAVSGSTTLEAGLARKTRSPNYLERYLWIPLEVNAGLGDGNNYVGDIELEPEVSHQAELGLSWQGETAYFAPRVYYRRVDDYIQGVPATDMFVRAVSGNANGDANPLRFANVEAEIYGLDAMYGMQFGRNWSVDGTITWTRGKRRDIDDNLYRIAPPNTRLQLNYRTDSWGAAVEGVAFARQQHISETVTGNSAVGSTAEVPGHAILNLYAYYELEGTNIRVRGGIENLFDNGYVEPLSGFNRVLDSDVAVGERLPGSGRNFHASLTYTW